jgi:hypothetical protein
MGKGQGQDSRSKVHKERLWLRRGWGRAGNINRGAEGLCMQASEAFMGWRGVTVCEQVVRKEYGTLRRSCGVGRGCPPGCRRRWVAAASACHSSWLTIFPAIDHKRQLHLGWLGIFSGEISKNSASRLITVNFLMVLHKTSYFTTNHA